MKAHSRQLLAIFSIFLFLFPFLAQGQNISIPNPLNADTFAELIDALVNIIFYLAIVIAPLMIIVAGFYFVTAAQNPNQINTAKQIILWTLIGLMIVICAKGIINLFKIMFI